MDVTEVLRAAQDKIMMLEDQLAAFYMKPVVHATVITAGNEIDPDQFELNDLVAVMEEWKVGRLVPTKPEGPIVNPDGTVTVMFADLSKHVYQIGLNGEEPKIKLLGKNDGTNVVVTHDGEYYEVNGVWGEKFQPGQSVKVNISTKQIVGTEGIQGGGDICFVKNVVDPQHVEIEQNGNARVVFNGNPSQTMETNDRIQLDKSGTIVLRHLGRTDEERYTLQEEINVTWSDIGGCEEAKEVMREVIELPYEHPEVYKYYNKRVPKGVLLFGPPGNGKTMLGKAAANSLAKRFGHTATNSGFIYVKGPELLSMWVGNTEQSIRELFHRGRKHHKKHKFPAILFIDEAEAILPQRGSHRSADVDKTIVPMFLSEMDGLEASHVIVILATNRAEMLDPAAIRDGRVDRRIKVPRPDIDVAAQILQLHLKGVPLADTDTRAIAALCAAEVFSKQWTLYKLIEKNVQVGKMEHVFSLKDCVSGAMLAGLVDIAVSMAMKRDLKSGKRRGVMTTDFKQAVGTMYRSQTGQNHHFDLEDYIDSHKVNKCDLVVDKYKVE